MIACIFLISSRVRTGASVQRFYPSVAQGEQRYRQRARLQRALPCRPVPCGLSSFAPVPAAALTDATARTQRAGSAHTCAPCSGSLGPLQRCSVSGWGRVRRRVCAHQPTPSRPAPFEVRVARLSGGPGRWPGCRLSGWSGLAGGRGADPSPPRRGAPAVARHSPRHAAATAVSSLTAATPSHTRG